MNFGEALENLKEGRRVQREGWNGKGMWVAAQYPTDSSKMAHPYVYMCPVDRRFVPWICSQTDMFADDWQLAE